MRQSEWLNSPPLANRMYDRFDSNFPQVDLSGHVSECKAIESTCSTPDTSADGAKGDVVRRDRGQNTLALKASKCA